MEGLTRLVTESLVRHGFDRPPDYRRLQWSRWFRCESHHSLLFVPSKPGVFAVAEEVADFSTHVTTTTVSTTAVSTTVEERRFSAASSEQGAGALVPASRRMLAVTQFFEDDDMAFVLDRMLSRENSMRTRLTSGRYFVRFVVIEDQSQRHSICSALNQWMANSAEKATGIGPHFATSLELTPATEYIPQPDDRQQDLFDDANGIVSDVARAPSPATAGSISAHVGTAASAVQRSEASGPGTNLALHPSTSIPTAPHLDSGAASNIHCPSPLPSGF